MQPTLGELEKCRVEDVLTSLVLRLPLGVNDHAGKLVTTHNYVKSARNAAATRSSSDSVSRVWNGSASALSNACFAPGNGP